MKTALKAVAAVYLTCPYCDEGLVNDDGSFMFTESEYPTSPTIVCPDCGEQVRIPANPFLSPAERAVQRPRTRALARY